MVLGDKTKCTRTQVTRDSEFLLVLGCVHELASGSQAKQWIGCRDPATDRTRTLGWSKYVKMCQKLLFYLLLLNQYRFYSLMYIVIHSFHFNNTILKIIFELKYFIGIFK